MRGIVLFCLLSAGIAASRLDSHPNVKVMARMDLWPILIGIAAVAATLAAGYLIVLNYRRQAVEQTLQQAQAAARDLLAKAEADADNRKKELLLEAKEASHQLRLDAERDIKDRQAELAKRERRLEQKEEALDQKLELQSTKEQHLLAQERELDQKAREIDTLLVKQEQELERLSGLTADAAKELILKRVEESMQLEIAKIIRQAESEARETADKKAREIVTTAIQRCAVDHCVESTVSVVTLPSDDMKGRIIGREGRNIRALEHATGIDLIIDDTPEAVVLSSFDPVRREIARIALTSLIADGRITPQRIEEQVEKARREVETRMKEDGEAAILELGIQGAHPEVIRTLGRLRYRTSYGQNVLAHSKEVAFIASMIASEIGANVAVAKRAALFHDLGKAVSHEQEGSHAVNGAEIARKYGENPAVVHAIGAHHNDEEPSTVEAVIVLLADAISAARPGARRDNIDIYIKRLEKLEEIATSYPGIEKSFAIQAGREIRVMVQPEVVDDAMSAMIARDIAKRIESEMEYPGMIKVTVIRETRSTEFAK